MSHTEGIRACVLAVPEMSAWPELGDLFERAAGKPRPDWEWPILACQAVGGEASQAIPGAAAIACMYISIILIDDMLDDDPRGEHLRVGCGQAANMALAFQAAAFRAIEQAEISAERRAAIVSSLAWLALGTAAGQHTGDGGRTAHRRPGLGGRRELLADRSRQEHALLWCRARGGRPAGCTRDRE